MRVANLASQQDLGLRQRAVSPRWRYVYFLLAAFDLVTVCAGLYLNHEIMGIYTQSVAVNRIWAERVAAYSHLGELAAEVDAPGNDVFDNHDVLKETARMRAAEKVFDQDLATQRREMNANLAPDVAAPLLALFNAIALAKSEMTAEAERIFEYFMEGRADLAGERMATMDHKYAHLNAALLELRQAVSVIQERNFNEQTAAAAALQRYEYLIGVSIVLMVIGATFYGHKIAQQMQADGEERERNFNALGEAAARTRSILDTAAEGIVTFDRHGRIESFNKAAEELFGYAASQATEQNIRTLIPALSDALELPPGVETVGLRRDGTSFFLELSCSTIGSAAEPVTIGIVRDVTDRRKAEEALRVAAAAQAANRAKSQFLANMSHEIRTPLNGVLGMSEMLLDTKLTRAQRHLADTVHRSGETLLEIIENILDFSKIEAGKMELESIEFNPRKITEDALNLMAESAKKKDLRLLCEIAENVPYACCGEPFRLHQVLTNLIGNAIKFTERGQIVVHVARVAPAVADDAPGRPPPPTTDTLLRFVVADSGIGISAAAQAQLFQPFTQADSSTTRRYGGTGLGLAISKELVERMGGQIGVRSRLGEGAEFWFTVRLAATPGAAERAPTALQDPPRLPAKRETDALSGVRVLLAEDNEVNQDVTRTMLESLGCRVRVVDNGGRALAALAEAEFDIVLMDRHMPQMDGIDATAQIRHRGLRRPQRLPGAPESPRLPIIGLTASALQGDRDICLQAGMDDYLVKPFRREALRQVIERWVFDGDADPLVDNRRAPEAAPGPSFDRSTLEQIRQNPRAGTGRIVGEMIDRYLADAAQLLSEIAGAAERSDAAALARSAHALRLGSDFLGARRLAELCSELEGAALGGETPDFARQVAALHDEYAVVRNAVLEMQNEA